MTRSTIAAALSALGLALALPAMAQDNEERQEPRPASGELGATSDRFLQTEGEALYLAACAGCHQPQGQGAVGAAQYPTLAANARLQGARYPAWIVLNGMGAMPSFADWLSDEQVIAVIGYVRSHLGNRYEPSLTEDDVETLRDAPAPSP